MGTVIGGSDGPTAIFLAGKVGTGWFNPFGLFFILIMLLPNILYAVRFRGKESKKCENRIMVVLEQAGRYLSVFLMVFNVGVRENAFSNFDALTVYLIVNAALLTVYSIIWIAYFFRQGFYKSMLLAVIPVCMFLFSGIIMRYVPLIASAVVFGIGHIYVTCRTAAPVKEN